MSAPGSPVVGAARRIEGLAAVLATSAAWWAIRNTAAATAAERQAASTAMDAIDAMLAETAQGPPCPGG